MGALDRAHLLVVLLLIRRADRVLALRRADRDHALGLEASALALAAVPVAALKEDYLLIQNGIC